MLASLELRLELPGSGFCPLGPGFGLNAGFLLNTHLGFGLVGAVPLVPEPGYVPSGGRVVPAQPAILPSEVQVQDRAVALVSPVVNPFNGDWLVDAVNQSVPGQGAPWCRPPESSKRQYSGMPRAA